MNVPRETSQASWNGVGNTRYQFANSADEKMTLHGLALDKREQRLV